MNKTLVCLTGMPGAGKSTIAAGLRKQGHTVLVMGDVIREEASRRGLEPTGPNLGRIMLEMRERGGGGAVAEMLLPKLSGLRGTIIIDGVRSNAEIEVLKRAGRVRILAVHASADTRFQYLAGRGRPDDPSSARSFAERDDREMGVGITRSIALADETISNNNLTRDELISAAQRIIDGWS